MQTTKVSVRGQIAIPKKLREQMRINEGDLLEVSSKTNLIILKKVKNQINGKDIDLLF